MSVLGAPARESYASALWKRLKTQHVWLLPCYVKRADPFTRLRRMCCLVSAIGIHVLWMAMLVLVSHSSLELTETMPRRALAFLLIVSCCITTMPITKSVCTLYEASVMMALEVPPQRGPPVRLPPRNLGVSAAGGAPFCGADDVAAPAGSPAAPRLQPMRAHPTGQQPERKSLLTDDGPAREATVDDDILAPAREPQPQPEPELDQDKLVVHPGPIKQHEQPEIDRGKLVAQGQGERRKSAVGLLSDFALATAGALPPLVKPSGQLVPIANRPKGADDNVRVEPGLGVGWAETRLKGGSGAGLPSSMRDPPRIPPRGAAAQQPEAGMNCVISFFLFLFSSFTVIMLYLYYLKLEQEGLVTLWVSCSCVSLTLDCVVAQPVKIFLNSRKAIKFARQQANDRISARAAGGSSRCCAVLQQKHFWLLSCFIEPPDNPFTLGRRLVTQFFVLLYFTAGSAWILRVFSPEAEVAQTETVDETAVIWLSGILTSLLMFPISKLCVDLSTGAKEDTDAVIGFGQGQVVRRSKSARCALPFMIVGIIYALGSTAAECLSDGGLVAQGSGRSWTLAIVVALAVDALVLQLVRVGSSMMTSSGTARSAVAIEFDWI